MRKSRFFSRVAVASPKAAEVKVLLRRHGFSVVSSNPGLVVAFGGDGTLLESERLFPGVPKLGVRNSQRCHLCEIKYVGKHSKELVCWSCLEHGLESLKNGRFEIVTRDKVEAVYGRDTLTGLNEVQLHNFDPRRAVRLSVQSGKKRLVSEFIGDGLILATVFGATGYFQSVSRQAFRKGFGLAFNNPVVPLDPFYFPKRLPDLRVQVLRGLAWVLADNDPQKLIVPSGATVLFRRSKHSARFVVLR